MTSNTNANTDDGGTRSVRFTTATQYPLPSQKFMIPASWKRYQLSQLINKALSLAKPVPFDFLLRDEILRTSLGEWCKGNGVGEEETLEIEYIESIMPPERISNLPHDNWVSSVSCQLKELFLSASYDGHVRFFDHSQNVVNSSLLHPSPITSVCVVPQANSELDTITIATSSHDLTAQLTQISPTIETPATAKPLSTLHLHTGPVSSVSSNLTGSHLLTSSWDGLLGLWDTTLPTTDEVPPEQTGSGDRNKRRKVVNDSERPKRKAPVMVLKSHTARVSKVVFGKQSGNTHTAYSCGFDSTVRTWDVESGLCTHTINASEKPMVDLAVTRDENIILAASIDRTVTVYDIRNPSTTLKPAVASLPHPATLSCTVTAPSATLQLVTGAYDGVVRLWDLRSVKSSLISFKAWDGQKKVLALDWAEGVVGVGGEGGMELWRVGEDVRVAVGS